MPLYLKHSRLFSAGVRIEYRVCVREIDASRNAINMQIIKQKSHVSANARSECVYLQNNLSEPSIFFFIFTSSGCRWGVTTKPVLKTRLSCSFISLNCCLYIKSYPRIARKSHYFASQFKSKVQRLTTQKTLRFWSKTWKIIAELRSAQINKPLTKESSWKQRRHTRCEDFPSSSRISRWI